MSQSDQSISTNDSITPSSSSTSTSTSTSSSSSSSTQSSDLPVLMPSLDSDNKQDSYDVSHHDVHPSTSPTYTASEAVDGLLLDAPTLQSLHELLFGRLSAQSAQVEDIERWHLQGFTFSSALATSFGLTQFKGGPCGVLASVQAFVLYRLVFGGQGCIVTNELIPLQPTHTQREEALAWALASIVIRATPTGQASYRLVSGTPQALYALTVPVQQQAEVHAFFNRHLKELHSPFGVILFLYSVLLSRGVENIKQDMDDSTSSLVGRYGHSAQELVNLLLTGAAVTNTFDGNKALSPEAGSLSLKGIHDLCDVGFLSLHEALRYTKVGQFYKCPNLPIWVIASDSHYTVAFSNDRRVSKMTKQELKQHKIKLAFDQLDPEGNGFIPIVSIPSLLEKLGSPCASMSEDLFTKEFDPDGMGLALWNRIEPGLENLEKIRSEQEKLNADWACGMCTFINPGKAKTCDMCATARPAPVVVPVPAVREVAEEKAPSSFFVWFFNGIEIPGKTSCQCVRLRVTIIEGGPGASADGPNREASLREILLTRWPGAIVEFEPGYAANLNG